MEKEENATLPFLDMEISRKNNGVITKVYRKDTHTNRYLNWRSNHSRNVLIGVIKTLVYRAHRLCDLKEDLVEELNNLRDVFISNGYPPNIVNKTIEDSWIKELKRSIYAQMEKDEEDPKEFYDVLHAPYVKGFSERLQAKIHPMNVGFVMKKAQTIQSIVCKGMKPKQNLKQKKDVVYMVQCETCDMKYIGETRKMLETRISQHQKDVQNRKDENSFFCHVKMNKGHRIDWDGTKILEEEDNTIRRKIKESIFIEALNPGTKMDQLMNLEKGVQIDKGWKILGGEIRRNVERITKSDT
jgi:hypothetical protein